MLYIPTMWYYDISVTYFAGFQSVKFVIIPHVLFSKNFCEILLYNPPLVVLTYGAYSALNSCETGDIDRHAQEQIRRKTWGNSQELSDLFPQLAQTWQTWGCNAYNDEMPWKPLHWRHNERDGVSDHQRLHC